MLLLKKHTCTYYQQNNQPSTMNPSQYLCKSSILSYALFQAPFLLSFFITLLHSPLSAFEAKTFYGNDTDRDRLALLAIKDQILDNYFGVVKKWNDFFHFCNWEGVTCSRCRQRVTGLNLISYGLVGSLSPHIGNYTFLSKIVLNFNHFHQQILQEVGRLFRL